MRVIIFGATGMIGEAALIECLEDDSVEHVLAVVRRPLERKHDKLEVLVHDDFLDFSKVEHQLSGYDVCLYCLGVSSSGVSEADYRRITHDFTVAAAQALLRVNPRTRMCFVSGAGTDANSKTMWARVKGEAEQALLGMPFESAHMFRPAAILPEKGVVSRVRSYRLMYRLFGGPLRLMRVFSPGWVTTTPIVGRALLRVGRDGHPKAILEGKDIDEAGR